MRDFVVIKTNRDEWINNGKFKDYQHIGYFKERAELDEIVKDGCEYTELTKESITSMIKESDSKGDDAFCSWLVAIYNTKSDDEIILITCD